MIKEKSLGMLKLAPSSWSIRPTVASADQELGSQKDDGNNNNNIDLLKSSYAEVVCDALHGLFNF